MSRLFNTYLGAGALAVGFLLGGYPTGVVPTNFYRHIDFFTCFDWHVIGAALTIYGLFSCRIFQKILSTRVFKWLGQISYSVYLIHILILFSLTTSLYKWMIAYAGHYFTVGICFVVSLIVLLGTSFLYQKYAERTCNALQDKIFKLLEK